jgi:radical SAM-linked protein
MLHHSNLAAARADSGKLVCYNCGVACDLDAMRERRLASLESLGAERPPMRDRARQARPKAGKPVRRPQPNAPAETHTFYRLRYTKLGRAAFLGHLDTVRVLARTLRRAGIEVAYTRGFHPKPIMRFGPALALGVASLGEYVDIGIVGEEDADELLVRLQAVCPEGNECTGLWELPAKSPGLGKLITAYELAIKPVRQRPCDSTPLDEVARGFLESPRVEVARGERLIDVRALVDAVAVVDAETAAPLYHKLGWPLACLASGGLLCAQVDCGPNGSAKPKEVAMALGVWGSDEPSAEHALLARLGFKGLVGHPGE